VKLINADYSRLKKRKSPSPSCYFLDKTPVLPHLNHRDCCFHSLLHFISANQVPGSWLISPDTFLERSLSMPNVMLLCVTPLSSKIFVLIHNIYTRCIWSGKDICCSRQNKDQWFTEISLGLVSDSTQNYRITRGNVYGKAQWVLGDQWRSLSLLYR
jgi:hypothetical protein